MKRYRKSIPVLSPNISIIAAALAAAATLAAYIRGGIHSDGFMIGSCFFIVAGIFYMMDILANLPKYFYATDMIHFKYLRLTYRKLSYQQINKIVISNAVYSDMHPNYWIIYKIKNKTGKAERIIYPYITLQLSKSTDYRLNKLQKGMGSVRWLDPDNMVNLGICWFDSLSELLHYTDAELYILEDVYLRFYVAFDQILEQYNPERSYIISDTKCSYKLYKEGLG